MISLIDNAKGLFRQWNMPFNKNLQISKPKCHLELTFHQLSKMRTKKQNFELSKICNESNLDQCEDE